MEILRFIKDNIVVFLVILLVVISAVMTSRQYSTYVGWPIYYENPIHLPWSSDKRERPKTYERGFE